MMYNSYLKFKIKLLNIYNNYSKLFKANLILL